MYSERNAGIFLVSTDTKVQLKIVMQQPLSVAFITIMKKIR
jgi:hypothetical protein